MMNILEEMDKKSPYFFEYEEIRQKFGIDIVHRIRENGLIDYAAPGSFGLKRPVRISRAGYNFLWSARIKESINKMDSSIKTFSRESRKTARSMWLITFIMAIFTTIMGIIAIFSWPR